MSKNDLPVNQRFSKRFKRSINLFVAVVLPLFLFLYTGQTLHAAMGKTAVFYQEISAVKALALSDTPTINIWYGDEQHFGQLGNPQTWINILGNVSDTDGIALLSYTLNGGPVNLLNTGPDTRRLAKDGDFNVDIAITDLNSGINEVLITAVDSLGNSASKTVSVTYETGNVWPLPYSIDWSTVTDIQSVAQVIDGEWQLTGNGLRNHVPDYDRLVGIGDVSWTDYEVVVPITIHAVDPDGFQYPSVQPGVGVLMRWTGHTDTPIGGWQPKSGYYPIGAIGWWQWNTLSDADLEFWNTSQATNWTPQLETPYMMKVRVDSVAGQGSNYKIKVWQVGQAEPDNWDLTYQAAASDLANGSVLLIAHHVDATFGNVTIYPTNMLPTYNLTTTVSGNGSVIMSPDQTSFNLGQIVTLTAVPDLGHQFTGWSGNAAGTDNPLTMTMTGDLTITANFAADSNKVLTLNTEGSGSVFKNPDQADYLAGTPVTITAVPASGWVFSDWNGDISSSVNPTVVTLTQDMLVTGTFLADTFPPIISNIQVDAGETEAVVSWQTDEAADSHVSFGPTAAYENGTISDSSLLTSHNITLTGLLTDTLYHYQITSVDGVGNPANSADLTFQTGGSIDPSGIKSDDFNGCTLDTAVWTLVNPVGDGSATLLNGQLVINVPAGAVHDPEIPNTAVRLMQAANDTDFELEVKFDSAINQSYQEQGLIIEQDSYNYIRFDFYSVNSTVMAYAAGFSNGSGTSYANQQVSAGTPMYMRVTRVGDQWTQAYSNDGSNWTTSVSFNRALSVNQVGVFGGNYDNPASSAPAHTALVDYFVNTAVPASQVNGGTGSFIVTTDIIGNGSVSKSPDQNSYACGAEVTLTATPASNWLFSGWSDAVTGSENPVTVTVSEDMTVTANFIENTQWNLDVQTVGNGSVTVTPDQPTYSSGQVVTLTAVPASNWLFSNWNGSVTGSENPVTITVTEDMTVTANFIENVQWNLGVQTIGNGSVTVTPDQAAYSNGQVVTLTAVADTGWLFNDWQGDMTGTTNPVTILMDGNKSITATFALEADTTPPVISNIQVDAGETEAVVSWQTDEAADSSIGFGPTTAYENGTISDSSLVTSHNITLTGLLTDTLYHYQITSIDGVGNPASSADLTFQTGGSVDPSGIKSDDFNGCTLDTAVWTLVNPVGDGSATLLDGQLVINVPAGAVHDPEIPNTTVRLMQAANDTDFELEVKFDSAISQSYQEQGLIIEQDSYNYIRFDFYSMNSTARIYAAGFSNGSGTSYVNQQVSTGAPMYMRVTRVGDQWTQAYSTDGSNWTTSISFNRSLSVNQVGVFGGNYYNPASSAPAHTALVDYFVNTAVPASGVASNCTVVP